MVATSSFLKLFFQILKNSIISVSYLSQILSLSSLLNGFHFFLIKVSFNDFDFFLFGFILLQLVNDSPLQQFCPHTFQLFEVKEFATSIASEYLLDVNTTFQEYGIFLIFFNLGLNVEIMISLFLQAFNLKQQQTFVFFILSINAKSFHSCKMLPKSIRFVNIFFMSL